MKVQINLIFSDHAENSPIVVALRQCGLEVAVRSKRVRLNYQSPLKRLFFGYSSIILFAMRNALFSLKNLDKNCALIVQNHFDILFISIFSLFSKHQFKIVYPGFIYTENNKKSLKLLKRKYYQFITSRADIVIVHSNAEIGYYSSVFKKANFQYFPYAHHIDGVENYVKPVSTSNKLKVLSAGRSGRDYVLFAAAVKNLGIDASVISDQLDSDSVRALNDASVEIIKNCYGEHYYNQIKEADLLVIPLKETNISAGQMVLIDAIAFGIPVIITTTETSIDYINPECGVIGVPRGSKEDLYKAINTFSTNRDYLQSLSIKARELYFQKYSVAAYAKALEKAVSQAFVQ